MTERKRFEDAWNARPWILHEECDKDRAWRWWQTALSCRSHITTPAQPVAWRSRSFGEPLWEYDDKRMADDDLFRAEEGFEEEPLFAAQPPAAPVHQEDACATAAKEYNAVHFPCSAETSDDLVERLRNPMWAHGNVPFESPQLEQDENIAAMNEAAAEIERLRIDHDNRSKLNHARAKIIEECMDMLADVPGDGLIAKLTEYIGSYMALQIKVSGLPQEAPNRENLRPFAEWADRNRSAVSHEAADELILLARKACDAYGPLSRPKLGGENV